MFFQVSAVRGSVTFVGTPNESLAGPPASVLEVWPRPCLGSIRARRSCGGPAADAPFWSRGNGFCPHTAVLCSQHRGQASRCRLGHVDGPKWVSVRASTAFMAKGLRAFVCLGIQAMRSFV